MSRGDGSVDFLISYAAEDRDWAEWIASHLGAMGYSYALQEPPSASGTDPFAAPEITVSQGGDVIIVLSLAFIEALLSSGAAPQGRLRGPGRTVMVQIEAVQAPPDLRLVPTAPMHHTADDYEASRDLLVSAVRAVRPSPSGEVDQRVPLPAPTALAESYPVPAPPPNGPAPALLSSRIEGPDEDGNLLVSPSGPSRSAGLLLGGDRVAGRSEVGGDHPDLPFDQQIAEPAELDVEETETADAEAPGVAEVATEEATDEATGDAIPAEVLDEEAGQAEVGIEETLEFIDLGEHAAQTVTTQPAAGNRTLREDDAEAAVAELEAIDIEVVAPSAVAPSAGAPAAETAAEWAAEEVPAAGEQVDEQIVSLPHPRPVFFWDRTDALSALASSLATVLSEASDGAALEQPTADQPTVGRSGNPVVTLVGPAGSGKSTLAVEHACQHLDDVDVVWWVRSSSRASLVADLRALCRRLQLAGDTPEQQIAALREWLEHTSKSWLVIFDGVVSGPDLVDVLPKSGRGQAVITTANRGLEGAGTVIEVGGLNLVEGTSFLLGRTSRKDDRGATEVARRLGGSPAALNMAGSYVATAGATFSAYLDIIDDTTSPISLKAATPVASVEWCVLAALRAISDVRPWAAPALVTLALGTADAPLPPELVGALSNMGAPLVDLLSSYGLAVADDEYVVVPSAVRQALAYLVPAGASVESRRRLIAALEAEAAAVAPGSPEHDIVLPHAARLVRTPDVEPSPGLARLAALATAWTADQGARHEAVVLAERNLELHERAFGEDDPTARQARQLLADLYVAVADTPRAVVAQTAVLADCEDAFGPDDLQTIRACAALAASYADLGDYARAVALAERALAELTEQLGPDHPETQAARQLVVASRASLANTTLFAPEYRQEAGTSDLATTAAAVSTEPPDAATFASEIAEADTAEAETAEAETAEAEAETAEAETAEAETAEAEAETAEAGTAEAGSLEADTAEYDVLEAEALQAEALQAEALQAEALEADTSEAESAPRPTIQAEPEATAQDEAAVDEAEAAAEATVPSAGTLEEEPETGAARGTELEDLEAGDPLTADRGSGAAFPGTEAEAENALSQAAEAEAAEVSADRESSELETEGSAPGEAQQAEGEAAEPEVSEPDTTVPTDSLVTPEEAVSRLTAELSEIEAQYGGDSVEAITALHQLALAQGDVGHHTEAVALLTTVVGRCEELLGSSHPDTLTARANLANAHAETGDLTSAIACQERVLTDHEQLLGPDDPLTLAARNSLANDYATAGLTEQALTVQQRVAADYERLQGPRHPRTLTAQHNLANSYAELGQHEQALNLRLKVLEERERTLGPDDPQTLGARNNLANSYADLGQHDEALMLRTEVLEARERVLGAEHPQTLGARNNLANSYADLGQHARALQLRSQVLEARERVLGPDHPHTLTARNNLANSYAAMGQHQEALALRERALADCDRVLGSFHPHTLTARNNLANTWAAMGDEARAEEIRNAPMAPAPGTGVAAASGAGGQDTPRSGGSPLAVAPTVAPVSNGQNGHDNGNGRNGRNGHRVRNGHGEAVGSSPGKPPRKRRFWFWAR